MLKSLLARLGASNRIAIEESLWNDALARLPFVTRLDPIERQRLRALCERLLSEKEMTAAGSLELTASMQVMIAVQACLPVLNLGIEWYRGWSSIIVYPGEFIVPREQTDEAGVVHEYTETICGEAWDGGPLLLSWEDAAGRGTPGLNAGCNVVIHEFTHKLDMLNGEPDGVPPFDPVLHSGLHSSAWRDVLLDAYERFNAELELLATELPAGIDPDSDEADSHYLQLPLDPYAAHSEGEFFAVSSEAFFVDAARLEHAFPAWYRMLAAFFRQDPLAAGTGPRPGQRG